MNNKYENKELSGSLWDERNCKVIRKGKIKIEGQDRYASIIEYSPDENAHMQEKKYELVVSIGLLHHNKPEDKKDENSPDIYGAVTFNNKSYKFGGWKNVTQKGTPYTNVNLKYKEDEKEKDAFEQDRENIPF
tara:strand:+ start:145 stop:543 length:399 start_codon:yes stop_codon:yes gene_type:complete